ncbi:MAG: dienelactone hydrolase family protein [Gammaproteobacteria bacterium]|nr:dienelactone hydrolase family protein [Gammaproteobacteria bacterium]NIO62836.1 dienelactone hydrolase family protein [Gammaproteobacteria bacterium]
MKKASDFDQEVLDLFNLYVHSKITRREFLDRASKYAVGGLTATAILESLQPQYAEAQQIAPDDSRITTQYVEYQSPQGYGTVRGLLAAPANASGDLPAVLVIHENRGLNPYIEDVTRRAAVDGFLALGPDALTSLGGYPGTDDEGREMQRQLDGDKIFEDFVAGAEYLRSHAQSSGRVGAVGFCFGGGVVNRLAARLPWLGAGAPYYGRQVSAADAAKINAPLQIHYASLDERINAGWPDYEVALKQNNKDYEVYFYDNTNHGFHNDTTPRYDEDAAKLAWSRTMEFFKKHLT